MKKILLVISIILLSIALCGCEKTPEHGSGKVELPDRYYGSNGFIESDKEEIENLLNKKESFILFTYNNFCTLPFPCEKIFEEYMTNNKVRFLSLPFSDFKETSLYETIKYAPTIVIINKGKIESYLDAESDADFNKYQDVTEFSKWIDSYIK
jgi:hypothetical protein